MQFQVTVQTKLSYDITVNAPSFQEAAAMAAEAAVKIDSEIIEVSRPLVPDEYFTDTESEVIGIWKQ